MIKEKEGKQNCESASNLEKYFRVCFHCVAIARAQERNQEANPIGSPKYEAKFSIWALYD